MPYLMGLFARKVQERVQQQFRQAAQEQQRQQTSSGSSKSVPDKGARNKSFFNEDDGEYVDFEEVKD